MSAEERLEKVIAFVQEQLRFFEVRSGSDKDQLQNLLHIYKLATGRNYDREKDAE